MGWSLNAGGTISKEIKGWDDFMTNPLGYYYQQNTFPSNTTENDMNPETFFQDHEKYMSYLNSTADSEPDIFYFNFANYTGSMFFTRQNTNNEPFATIKKNDFYIKAQYNIAGKTWTVYDGDGYQYLFNSYEKNWNYSKTDENNNLLDKSIIPINQLQPEVITAWVLTQIVSPSGNVVTFTYKDDEIYTIPNFTENKIYSIASGGNLNITMQNGVIKNYSHTYSKINQKLLTEINFRGGEIQFITSDRHDIQASGSTNTYSQKLDEILISNGPSLINKFDFNYLYNGNSGDYKNCRLMLNKITYGLTANRPQFQFTYNNGVFPAKNSNQTDFWGYFNQKPVSISNDFTLTPTVKVQDSYFNKVFTGRDLDINKDVMQYGMLQSVQYPTGSKSMFYFSPHKFSNGFNGGIKYIVKSSLMDYFNDNILITQDNNLTIEQPGYYKLSLSYEKSGSIILEDELIENNIETKLNLYLNGQSSTAPPVMAIYDFECNKLNDSIITYVNLQSGTYKMQLVKNNESGIYTIRAKAVLSKVTDIICLEGGGLKIDSIKIFDPNNVVQSKRKYLYEQNNVSTGKLMVEPKYVFNWNNSYQIESEENIDVTDNSTQISGYVYGMSVPYRTFTGSASGSNVGYSKVVEYFIDCLNQSSTGKTEYYYDNEPDFIEGTTDRFIPNFPTVPNYSNGNLVHSLTYNSNGNLIKEVVNSYLTNTLKITKGVKVYRFPTINPSTVINNTIGNFPDFALTFIKYYDLTALTNQLVSTTNTEYNLSGLQPITTFKELEYNDVNYLVKKVRIFDSKNNIIENIIRYPSDFTSELETSMVSRNFVNATIETLSLKNNSVNSAQKMLFKDTLNMFLPAYNYRMENTIPVLLNNYQNFYKSQINFEKYNSAGKIIQYRLSDNTPVTMIWGYENLYPIAEIKNGTYSEVMAALNYSNNYIEALSSSPLPEVDYLRTKLFLYFSTKTALVTTYTYKPLIGIATMTDSRGVTTTYLYDEFNRLKTIQDKDMKSIQSFDYNYKH